MDIFSPQFFSFLFKALVVLFVFSLIVTTARRLRINKTIAAPLELPDEKRQNAIVVYKRMTSMLRVLLWMASLLFLFTVVLLVYLLIFRAYLEAAFQSDIQQILLTLTMSLVLGHIYLWEDFFYKKKILKALEKSTERKTQ